MKAHRLAVSCHALIVTCAMTLGSVALADTDACTLLTTSQVSTAIGIPVGAGTHVTPTFVKTCTWNPSSSSEVRAVTLYLQTVTAYDGGKRMASLMAARSKDASVQPVAVGDDAYYFIAGGQVGLLVKKGGASFKATVYATLPVSKKQAMELALAKAALAKL